MVCRGLFGKIRGHPTVRPRANSTKKKSTLKFNKVKKTPCNY